MWFLPSYNRPHALKTLQEAPGGMPTKDLVVILNADDPQRVQYEALSPWPIEYCPAGSRLSDAWHYIEKQYSHLPWIGMLGDDHIAQTPGWHERLVEAAADRYLSYPNGEHTEFPLMRGVCVLGGELVRAIGWIYYPPLKHNYVDVVLDTIARDIGHLRPLEDVRVDHRHWKFCPDVVKDATYERGSTDQTQDMIKYHEWLGSYERAAMHQRLCAWRDGLLPLAA